MPLADAARAFGARANIQQVSLSPDGKRIAYITPSGDAGSAVLVRDVADDAKPVAVLGTKTGEGRLATCRWVSNERLVCTGYGTTDISGRMMGATRVFAVDAAGTNLKALSLQESLYSHGISLYGGGIVDWLPGEDGSVLMARSYVANDHLGTRLGSEKHGLAVDHLETRTLTTRTVEQPHPDAISYLSDGYGEVRIMATVAVAGTGMETGRIHYLYRRPGSREWERLSDFDEQTSEGFVPLAIDREHNVAYGLMKSKGRDALYTRTLDGRLQDQLVLARPDVDVEGLITLGRSDHVVGATFQTDAREVDYFDPAIRSLMGALARALPKQPDADVVDASLDQHKLLVFAGSDNDPGAYYLLDRDRHDLHVLFPARPGLEGHALASMRALRYPASDGTIVPAYLTLPPGRTSAKGLPAIVLPHGGPTYRDRWGFDWLPQFYASQGFAVLQPEYRGSSGYGDDWFQHNAFHSWRLAISDVTDGGRWLVAQGADPARLAIVGWSFGGYAALQSAVTAPDLFKHVVAIAPVTDLTVLRNESSGWSDYALNAAEIGTGSGLREASPAENAARIKAPVLLVHGTKDANVGYQESRLMESRLRAAGKSVRLITFDGLDHQLPSDEARIRLLTESVTFLQGEPAK